MGNRRLIQNLLLLGPPAEIYEMAKQGMLSEKLSGKHKAKAGRIEESAVNCNVIAEYEEMTARGISFVAAGEDGYPGKLKSIPDAPGALYYVGKLPRNEEKTIAIIGARNCSEYGRAMARQFGEILAGAGVQIVSGMARGIDGIGQQAALDVGGYSLGVLGCGVDICYPRENRQLYERLIAEGGICSEYPPGIEPRAVLFPPRNRIISGLCDGVLVIEAKERSGTLITVDMALEQGREVYALPGRTTDPLSRGCNMLIRQGAGIAVSPQELLRELKPDCVGFVSDRQQAVVVPEGMRGRLLQLLDYQPASMEVLQRKYADMHGDHILISELCYELLQLCADGLAEQISGSYYVRKG
ncbi:MAG: DNA-processing protein DprA [Lachnospiraceae bacterium]|nr:DNA-processing protein DprA [Lachnospiraceae bacterium]